MNPETQQPEKPPFTDITDATFDELLAELAKRCPAYVICFQRLIPGPADGVPLVHGGYRFAGTNVTGAIGMLRVAELTLTHTLLATGGRPPTAYPES